MLMFMRRHWRPGRLLLAGISFILALCVYALWPAQKRYGIPNKGGVVVGFEERTLQAIDVSSPSATCMRIDKNHCFFNDAQEEFACNINAINLADGSLTQLCQFPCKSMNPYSFQISQHGRFLACIQSDIQLIDLRDRKQAFVIKNSEREVTVAFSADDRYLAVVTRKGVQVWDVETQKCINEFVAGFPEVHSPESNHIQFRDDGRYLAVLWGQRLGVYDLASHQRVCEMECDFGMPRFLADGTLGVVLLKPKRPLICKYRVNGDSLSKVALETENDTNTHFTGSHFGLALSRTHSLIASKPWKTRNWPAWFPDRMRNILDSCLPSLQPNWPVYLINFETGNVETSLTVPVTGFKQLIIPVSSVTIPILT